MPQPRNDSLHTFKAELLAGGETLELIMYDFIGEDFFAVGITDKMVQQALEKAPKAKVIRIRMNSPGGDGFVGFTIANLLRGHAARKEMDVEGLCASAATTIAAICSEVRMWPGSQMMIHEAQGVRRGQAHELRAAADMLENINRDAAALYAERTGKPLTEILAMMSAETWFNAEQAVAQKFADKVEGGSAEKAKAAAALSVGRVQHLHFRNAPAALHASMQAHGTESPALAWQRDRAELAELRGKQEESEIAAAIAKAKSESRHTPAREASMRAVLAAGDCTTTGALALIALWDVVKAIAAARDGASAATGDAVGAELTWNGKRYAELKTSEREELAKENPELFESMRKQWVAAGGTKRKNRS